MAEAGIAITAVVPDDHALREMPGISSCRLGRTRAHALRAIAAALRDTLPDLIVPADEWAIDLLGLLHDRALHYSTLTASWTARLIEHSLGSPSAFAFTRQKSRLIGLARREGIAVPRTKVVGDLRALRYLSEHELFPMVLKLDHSFGGHGVRVVRDAREAEAGFCELRAAAGPVAALKQSIKRRDIACLEGLYRRSPAISLQQFIDGTPANRAVACHRGKVLAGLSVEAVCTNGANGPATVVRIIDSPTMSEAAEKLVRRLGLSGFLGLDFMIDRKTGQPFFIELNARPTQICHMAPDTSADMVGTLAVALGALPVPRHLPNVGGPTIALFPQECWREPDSEYLHSAHHDVPWWAPEFLAAYRMPPPLEPMSRLKDMALRFRLPRRTALAPAQSFSTAATLLGNAAEPPSSI
jgi:glutathione synthase/RimK-type ligase-like ATP-grasp enzyme